MSQVDCVAAVHGQLGQDRLHAAELLLELLYYAQHEHAQRLHRSGLEPYAERLQLGEQGLLRTRRAVLWGAHGGAAQHDLQQPPLLGQVAHPLQ